MEISKLVTKGRLVLPKALEPMVRLIRAGLHPDRIGANEYFKLWEDPEKDKKAKASEVIEVIIVEPPKGPPLPPTREELLQAKADKQYADHVKRQARKK